MKLEAKELPLLLPPDAGLFELGANFANFVRKASLIGLASLRRLNPDAAAGVSSEEEDVAVAPSLL